MGVWYTDDVPLGGNYEMSRNIVVIRLGALLAMGVACVSVAMAHQEPGDVTKEVEKIAAMSPD